MTLRFEAGAYEPWPWTYADYRQESVRTFLKEVRTFYKDAPAPGSGKACRIRLADLAPCPHARRTVRSFLARTARCPVASSVAHPERDRHGVLAFQGRAGALQFRGSPA